MEASGQESEKEGSSKVELMEAGENDQVEIELNDNLTTVDESVWKLDGRKPNIKPVLLF